MTNFEKTSVFIAALAAFLTFVGIIISIFIQLNGINEIGKTREEIGEVELGLETKIDRARNRIDKLNREIGELKSSFSTNSPAN